MIPVSAGAQKFFYTQYLPNDGLPSDKIRMIVKDTLGFIWAATDAGLVRFNGKKFTDYRRALDSQYIKSLLLTRDGTLLLANDTGVFRVDYRADTAFVSQLIPGKITPSDTALLYPNGLFEDSRGRLWISQPNAHVVRWDKGTLTFFRFPEDHATGYSDSGFAFAEDAQGRVWVGATTGFCYYFEEEKGSFKKVPIPGSWSRISDIEAVGEELWIAGSALLRARAGQDGKLRGARYYPAYGHTITSMARQAHDGSLYLGTAARGLYRAEFNAGSMVLQNVFGSNDPHRIEDLPFKNIHHLFIDEEGSIWMSTRQGMGLLQSRFFESVFGLANNNTYFIHSAGGNRILLSFGDVNEIQPDNGDFFGEVLPRLEESFITGITTTNTGSEERLWLSTADGEVIEFGDKRRRRYFDLSDRGSGIFFLLGDRLGNVWLCQAPDDRPIVGVAKLTPSGELRSYGREEGLDNRILVVRESKRGRIYAAGIGPETYLYRYQPESDAFINLSLPLPFAYSQGFEVHDMDIDKRGIVWLGTTDGLLRYDLERVQRVDLGELTANEIRAVKAMADGSIWLSTDTHVLHYQNGHFVLFDETSGLTTKVTTYRCLASDENGRLWVGTAEGTVYSRDTLPHPLITPQPVLLSLKAGDEKVDPDAQKTPALPSNSQLRARFVALTYPGKGIHYQHRLKGSADTSWSNPVPETSLRYGPLSHGHYQLEVRARQEGGYNWSLPLQVPFYVRQVWYKTWWATLLIILAGAVVLYYLVYLNVHRLVRRVRTLESALAKQREEIRRKDEELEEKNQTLHFQAQNLAEATAEISHQQEELDSTMSNLQMLHHIIRRIPRNAGWKNILEVIAGVISKTRGISAFEFGYYNKGKIYFEGYDRRNQSFTRRYKEFDEKSNLAVWALVHKESLLIGDYRKEQEAYVEPGDSYRFNSAIFLPFELAGRQQLILCVYSIYKNAFEEPDRMMLQLLTDHLGMVAADRLE